MLSRGPNDDFLPDLSGDESELSPSRSKDPRSL